MKLLKNKTTMMKKSQTNFNLILILVFMLSGIYSCIEDDIIRKPVFGDEEYRTMEQYIKENEDKYSMFIKVMKITGLDDALGSYNPNGINYTLFLPSNEAFTNFIDKPNDAYNSFEDLLNDSLYINQLVRYHLVTNEIHTNDFPFGSLSDSTITGDFLTIGFSEQLDTTVYKVNNEAPIVDGNIINYNGYIHVISKVLEPIVYDSYEWLDGRPGYTIITEAFEMTGLKDSMGVYRTSKSGIKIENFYTLLLERDSVFVKEEIYNIDDLIARVSPDNQNFRDVNNPLYQFTAYHILEGRHFLDEFITRNYNTYAFLPVNIRTGFEIQINKGVEVFDTLIVGTDTSKVDYLQLDYTNSNILTRNGAIHLINHVMELHKPGKSTQTYQFRGEEPVLQEAFQQKGTFFFENDNNFAAISWSGVDEISYVASSAASEQAWNKDYLELEGDFVINYRLPKILSGTYDVRMRANRNRRNNATIQVFIDGKKVGGNINLTIGGSNNNPYGGGPFKIGTVEFSNTRAHTVTIKALIPGRLSWDLIQFYVP